jgi:hypothetical protein
VLFQRGKQQVAHFRTDEAAVLRSEASPRTIPKTVVVGRQQSTSPVQLGEPLERVAVRAFLPAPDGTEPDNTLRVKPRGTPFGCHSGTG